MSPKFRRPRFLGKFGRVPVVQSCLALFSLLHTADRSDMIAPDPQESWTLSADLSRKSCGTHQGARLGEVVAAGALE